jgi:hypothetical protein
VQIGRRNRRRNITKNANETSGVMANRKDFVIDGYDEC